MKMNHPGFFKTPVYIVLASFATLIFTSLCQGDEPTKVDVRVISQGAKFIGSSMGGCMITIRDLETGELLAKGTTAGGTGDTELIMKAQNLTHAPVSTEDSAVFSAALDIDEPTHILVTATGPRAQKQGENLVSASQWIVPGKHVTGGDAFLLKLRGFIVDIKTPPTHVKITETPVTIHLSANVTMMCGCPIEPGGTWDADKIELTARVKHDGKLLNTIPLKYAGETSQFATDFEVSEKGLYEATVFAYDPVDGNTGIDKVTWLLK
ncbi:MAG: hypothetical protein P1U68_16420 [Verrucomicrobiales bacterium]|nr:hypothetical protein [Verrucomicrobiales bacterium]